MNKIEEFSNLKGKIIKSVEGLSKHSECITFNCTDGSIYYLYHERDCCESVRVEDIAGDVSDLIGQEILIAEESEAKDPGFLSQYESEYESCTIVFYTLRTMKGTVVIRWFGDSNGYYCEEAHFRKYDKDMDKYIIEEINRLRK